jgi:hypothetical protein
MVLAKANPTAILSNVSAAANASTTLSACTAIDTTSAIDLHLHCRCTYASGSTTGARVKLFTSYDGGTTWESNPFYQFDMPFVTNSSVQFSARVPFSPKNIRVQITNLDLSNAISAIYVYYTMQTA